jgi:protein tyrosine phosphatase
VKQTSRLIPLTTIEDGNVPIPSVEAFENLMIFNESIKSRFTTSQGQRYSKLRALNLHPTVLPFDHNRIRLRNLIHGCDYVNANWIAQRADETATYDEVIYSSYLPSFKIKFAVCQDPIPATMHHHHRLIHENKFDFLISFNEQEKEKPLTVGKTNNINDMTLKVLERKNITEHWTRTEMRSFDTVAPGAQYMHDIVHFEFNNWKTDEMTTYKDTMDLVKGLCLIRDEFKLERSSLKVLLHDPDGGVGGCAVFISLYEILQQIDESFTDDNKLKRSAQGIDVSNIVNNLRKDRANMVSDYQMYKLLFLSMGYYGPNRVMLYNSQSKNSGAKPASTFNSGAPKKVVKRKNQPGQILADDTPNDDGIEYVIHENSESDEEDLFDGYYDENGTFTYNL